MVNEIEPAGTKFTQALGAAARLPGVRVSRDQYLRAALRHYCTPEQIEAAVQTSPAAAGVPESVLTDVANTSIKYETSHAAGLSALAGLPGGFALVGTIPADLAQYMGHLLRISQKLAYVYGWPDLFGDEEDLDEATEGILTLFVGVMFGVQVAQGGVAKVAEMMAGNVLRKLPQKALTKGVVYLVVKKVAAYLGVKLTKKTFASGVAKSIPVAGAALSGGLTFVTFLPMSKKLQSHLESLEIDRPELA